MSHLFKNRDGQTPVDESIRKELIPSHVQDMSELYELESENIAQGISWTQSTKKDHLDYLVWLELHKHMFRDIWKFAGIIRKVELANPEFHMPFNVLPSLKELELDLKTWLDHDHSNKEVIAKFHERLLTIHPFRDGNGRWARILTEWVCERQKLEVPTWGSRTILDDDTRRDNYIEAVKEARYDLKYDKLIKAMWE